MLNIRNKGSRDFPGSPVFRICPFTAGGMGSVSGWETKIPLLHSTTKKRERERERERYGWGGDTYAYIRLQNVDSLFSGAGSAL